MNEVSAVIEYRRGRKFPSNIKNKIKWMTKSAFLIPVYCFCLFVYNLEQVQRH